MEYLEDIDDVISRFFTAVCDWEVVCLYNNNNIRRYLEDVNFILEIQSTGKIAKPVFSSEYGLNCSQL